MYSDKGKSFLGLVNFFVSCIGSIFNTRRSLIMKNHYDLYREIASCNTIFSKFYLRKEKIESHCLQFLCHVQSSIKHQVSLYIVLCSSIEADEKILLFVICRPHLPVIRITKGCQVTRTNESTMCTIFISL